MASDRFQRRIDRILDQIEDAADRRDWGAVRQGAQDVLIFDPENADAMNFLAAAQRALGEQAVSPDNADVSQAPHIVQSTVPSCFADGRYQVKKFLGEGGKKRVYLAHDTLLDREVAFALIKTEGLDETSRTRIQREAQAMGRLGSHPHIVTVFDLGQEDGQRQRFPPGLRPVESQRRHRGAIAGTRPLSPLLGTRTGLCIHRSAGRRISKMG